MVWPWTGEQLLNIDGALVYVPVFSRTKKSGYLCNRGWTEIQMSLIHHHENPLGGVEAGHKQKADGVDQGTQAPALADHQCGGW